MIRNVLVKALKTLASYIVLELSSFIKFSYIVGSQRLFFSGINIAGPLIGRYSGLGSFFLQLLKKSLRSNSSFLTLAYNFGQSFFNPLLYHIPTIVASGYWFSSNRLIRIGIPSLCMILFIAHPVGREAFFYSLFWLIPLAIHCLPSQRALTEALGTTFTAHAVGSVLHLYIYQMPALYWWGLMPIVVIERSVFALGMTVVFYGARYMQYLWSSYKDKVQDVIAGQVLTERI
jgi:hypothetical protein